MMKRETFIKKYEGDSRLRSVSPEHIYDSYMLSIRPYLSVISELIAEGSVTEKQIKMSLGISGRVWNACLDFFEDFKEVLESKERLAQLNGDLLLIKGMEATEYKNPKMIEMYQYRFNPKYKPKQDKVEVELPTVKIEYVDASIDEEVIAERHDTELE